jgi:hypothetical protein
MQILTPRAPAESDEMTWDLHALRRVSAGRRAGCDGPTMSSRPSDVKLDATCSVCNIGFCYELFLGQASWANFELWQCALKLQYESLFSKKVHNMNYSFSALIRGISSSDSKPNSFIYIFFEELMVSVLFSILRRYALEFFWRNSLWIFSFVKILLLRIFNSRVPILASYKDGRALYRYNVDKFLMKKGNIKTCKLRFVYVLPYFFFAECSTVFISLQVVDE